MFQPPRVGGHGQRQKMQAPLGMILARYQQHQEFPSGSGLPLKFYQCLMFLNLIDVLKISQMTYLTYQSIFGSLVVGI